MAITNSLQEVLSYFESFTFDEKTVQEIEKGLNVRILPTDMAAIGGAVETLKAAWRNIEAYNSLSRILNGGTGSSPDTGRVKRRRRTKAEMEAYRASLRQNG